MIPVAKADVGSLEEQYVVEAIRSTWISSTGKFIDRFESEFATLCDAPHCLGVFNGTVALHLALLGLDVRPGDEIIIPSLTYIATANAVRYVGAVPVFVDVDDKTWCIDPNKIEAAITPRTKGIIAVHLYGHPADMDAINHIAAVNGLWVVEDAAEAHTATYKGRPVGGLSDIATFSFFGNKIFTSGEGGALVFQRDQHLVRLRTLRGQGMDPNRRYYFPVVGYNFRITNVQAAFLCAQFDRRDEIMSARRGVFERYRAGLRNIPGIGLQPIADWAVPAPWLFCITVDERDFGMNRDQLMQRLRENGVDTRPFFIPIHTLPPYREESHRRGDSLPVTLELARKGLNLPTYNTMTNEEVDRVVSLIARR